MIKAKQRNTIALSSLTSRTDSLNELDIRCLSMIIPFPKEYNIVATDIKVRRN